jgi:hypothetical protein
MIQTASKSKFINELFEWIYFALIFDLELCEMIIECDTLLVLNSSFSEWLFIDFWCLVIKAIIVLVF